MSKNAKDKTAATISGHPNIIIILADDHGYGDLSSYGGPNLHTPNLDQLVSEGIKFTQFYANSPVCSPSRAALMTGRYPDLVGVPGVIRTHAAQNWGYFSQNAVTLPDMLKEAGRKYQQLGEKSCVPRGRSKDTQRRGSPQNATRPFSSKH